MIRAILDVSIERRWLVVVLCAMAAAVGGAAMTRLPIDAVPDITNNQVQIHHAGTGAVALEVEKQVTFRIETALTGIPASNTRFPFSQRFLASHGRVHGSDQHLLRAPADQ
jgi:Cu/Ag efflux pump CusA